MNSYEYQKLRGLKRKLYLINLRGGGCERCGYNKNISSLEFHHKNPNDKESQLDMRKLSNSTMKYILGEFDKCLLLCSNCHKEEHYPDLLMTNVVDLVKTLDEKIITSKTNNKPKCVDCEIGINYGHTRCRNCSDLKKRKFNPDVETLRFEIDKYGKNWCSKKYGVSRTTIRRFIDKL